MRRRLLLLALCVLPFSGKAAGIDVQVHIDDPALRENIQAFLGIYQFRNRDDLSAPAVRRLHDKARAEIERALQPFGYYRPEIQANLARRESGWLASYRIEPGPPVTIDSINIRLEPGLAPGAKTESGRAEAIKYLRNNTLQPEFQKGMRLQHELYSQFKTRLLKAALEKGFLDARFSTERLAVNTDSLLADIELALALGPRYRFGEVNFKQDILDDDFIRRFVEFEPGEPFNYEKLLDLQYSLIDSNYFARVNVEPLRDEAENHIVPIEVTAEENERSRYRVGFGYGTDTGGRLTLGFQRRYVNRQGHWFDAEAQLAEVRNSAAVGYNIPLARPSHEYFRISAKSQYEELADAETRSNELGMSRVRVLGNWQQTIYTNLRRETSYLPEGAFDSDSVIPGASWLSNRMDNPIYPTRGYKFYADLHGSHPSLGSDETYIQLRLQGRRAWPLTERLRFFTRLDLGITGIEKPEKLPVSERFFAGGDQSVRGFDYNRIGPQDGDGNVIGGRFLAVGSIQLDYKLTESWGASVFVDSGDAFNETADFEAFTGYGVGVIWFSPVGPVRLSIARPTDSALVPKSGYEIHFNFGPDL